MSFSLFFFNDPATTEIYTLSLHDALPISGMKAPNAVATPVIHPSRIGVLVASPILSSSRTFSSSARSGSSITCRSEEHTSELQSQSNLVCRLLLEKKKQKKTNLNQHQNTT